MAKQNYDANKAIDDLISSCDKKSLYPAKVAELTGFQRGTIHRIFTKKYFPKLDDYLKIKKAIDEYKYQSN